MGGNPQCGKVLQVYCISFLSPSFLFSLTLVFFLLYLSLLSLYCSSISLSDTPSLSPLSSLSLGQWGPDGNSVTPLGWHSPIQSSRSSPQWCLCLAGGWSGHRGLFLHHTLSEGRGGCLGRGGGDSCCTGAPPVSSHPVPLHSPRQ